MTGGRGGASEGVLHALAPPCSVLPSAHLPLGFELRHGRMHVYVLLSCVLAMFVHVCITV